MSFRGLVRAPFSGHVPVLFHSRESEPEPVKEDPETILLNTIRRLPGLNAPTLAERTGRSLRSTQRYLSQLKQCGAIRFEGVAKKGGYYANDGGVK